MGREIEEKCFRPQPAESKEPLFNETVRERAGTRESGKEERVSPEHEAGCQSGQRALASRAGPVDAQQD